MSETAQFTIGAEVSCSDGVCGEISRVVVDPIPREVTHLVVQPQHRSGPDRLVSLDLVDTTSGQIRLSCSLEQFYKLDPAVEAQFLPEEGAQGGYGPGQVLAWPYYGLGMPMAGFMGVGAMGAGGMGAGVGNVSQPVTYESVPPGEISVHRGDQVHATDGDIGRVQGLVVDPRNHHVTHVLLQEGHLWGRKQVAIPITAVTSVKEGIALSISKQEVQDLPPIELDPSSPAALGGPADDSR